jgi:hypothetical protein
MGNYLKDKEKSILLFMAMNMIQAYGITKNEPAAFDLACGRLLLEFYGLAPAVHDEK